MSKAVNSKWKKTFPDTIGNQNRPATGVDDTQPFETGGFPQYMANDPVRYDLQNAAMSQSMSNDARLKEMVDARGKELDDHKVDPGAHKTGIAGNAATATKVVTTAAAGASANIAEATMASNNLARIRVSGETNAGELALETADDGSEPIVARQYTGIYTTPVRTAKILDESGNTSFPGTVVAPKFTGSLNGNSATATKLQTPRTLSLTGKAAGSATFDGSANASINVTSVNADTASKLSTARKINITGNASGSAAFDGTSDVSINVSVSQAAHADKATQDTNGRAFTDTNAYMHISALADNTDFNNVKTTGIYYCTGNTYLNRPYNSWGILTVYSIGTVKQEYRPDNATVYYTREYNNTNWTAWSKVAASTADSATTATKVNATAPNGGAADLAFGTMAVNDYARVRVGGSNDNGWLEIATADGGNEPIYVRQYGGSYGWPNGRPGTVTNEAVLLDGSGNTKFPHNVTATNFVGHLTGNADSATNADKVDGIHAADLLRTLGGNRTPVITDIFDRAGTIDMSTMSAADKATHKANINKAENVIQDLWNNSTGIHAYGGDLDIAGYHSGALKLTQSYKNFDKILVVVTNDDANWVAYCMWDVWELAHAFANSYRFNLSTDEDIQWNVYGTAKHGTTTNYAVSTDTIWNTQGQNAGIIAIYGIKF